MRRRLQAARTQGGQSLILLAVIIVTLMTGIGLAIDASYDYYSTAAAGRAAAAAALSGVVFLPNQFAPANAVPALSKNDAQDRAIAEAKRNGFDTAAATNPATVTSVQVSSTKLQVTVSRQVPTIFLRMFGAGFQYFTVTQTAVATYLPPVAIGQPGGQAGSSLSQLGAGTSFYFMRSMGWGDDRSHGDAFGPNPAVELGLPLSPPSTDVHQISAQTNTDTADATLPARGGYNYLITVPKSTSAFVQVYNAAFAPDGNGALAVNRCDNSRQVISPGVLGATPYPCSASVAYDYQEGGQTWANKNTFGAMEYTLFKVSNLSIRSSDVELSKLVVLPIDSSNWALGKYVNVNTGATVNQGAFNTSTGQPSNMGIYHNWINAALYSGPSDGGLIKTPSTYNVALASGAAAATYYRLRVDGLNYNGTNPVSSTCVPATGDACSAMEKGYSVRAVLSGTGALCSTCTVSAWDDMNFFTPFTTVSGGSFNIPLFQLPAAYAGYTLYVDIFDIGDTSSPGNVDVNILSPINGSAAAACVAAGTSIATPTAPLKVSVNDLGTSRGSSTPTLIGNSTTATFRPTSGGTALYNGHWVELLIPVPATYNPGTNQTWCLQYFTSAAVTMKDTASAVVGLQGNPERLVSG